MAGASTTLTVGSSTDGNSFATIADFPSGNVVINWGDATTSNGTVAKVGSVFTVSGTHTYAAILAGTSKNITVTVTDDDGATTTLHGTVVIDAPAPR